MAAPPGGRLVLVLVAVLLMAPRIHLVPLSGSSVRVDDLVVVVLGATCLAAAGVGRGLDARVPALSLAVVATAAAVAGWRAGRVDFAPALLYALRPVQYWVVFAAVVVVVVRAPAWSLRRLEVVLALATCVQVGAALLQVVLGLDLGGARFSLQRGSGLTGGPYELGAMCAALAVLWWSRGRVLLLGVAALGVAVSSSRISLAALVLGVAALHLMRSRRRAGRAVRATAVEDVRRRALQRLAAGTLAVAAAVAAGPLWWPSLGSGLGERLATTSISEEWRSAGTRARAAAVPATAAEYSALAYSSVERSLGEDSERLEDVSTFVRSYRWQLLLRTVEERGAWLLGLGPSFAGPSVDGAYVRVLVTTGALGVAAWFLLLRRWVAGTPAWMVGCAVTLLVGALAIDLLQAMRPSVALWVLCALALAESRAGVEHEGGAVGGAADAIHVGGRTARG